MQKTDECINVWWGCSGSYFVFSDRLFNCVFGTQLNLFKQSLFVLIVDIARIVCEEV